MLNKGFRLLIVLESVVALAAGTFPLAVFSADSDGYQPRTRLSRPGMAGQSDVQPPGVLPISDNQSSSAYPPAYPTSNQLNDPGNYPQNDLGILSGANVALDGASAQSKHKVLQGGVDRSLNMQQQPFDLSSAQSALRGLTDQNPLSTGVGQTDLRGSANQRALDANASDGALRAGAARPALSAGTASTRIRGAVEQFRDHDVCLIIDRSSSMSDRDCPGGLSRWDWCARQSNELAQAAQMAASNLTLMVFSGQYDVYEHVSPMLIPRIFTADHPHGTTMLSLPLGDALGRYFATRQQTGTAKPLIIAIITDGLPWDFGAVESTIINAANNTNRDGEVSITFMLIGEKWNGLRRMEELDSDLVHMGAKRDIVNLVEFDAIMQLGAKQALAEALSGRQLRNNIASGPRLPFDMDGPVSGGGGSLKSLLNGLQTLQNMGMVPPMNNMNGMNGNPANPTANMFGGKNPFLK